MKRSSLAATVMVSFVIAACGGGEERASFTPSGSPSATGGVATPISATATATAKLATVQPSCYQAMGPPTPTEPAATTPPPFPELMFPGQEQWGLYAINADGSGLLRLADYPVNLLGWKDAQTAFVRFMGGVYEVDVNTGDRIERIYAPGTTGVLSPDGRYLAYTDLPPGVAMDESVEKEMLKIADLHTGAICQIDEGAIEDRRWSPDSLRLAYQRAPKYPVMLGEFSLRIVNVAELTSQQVDQADSLAWSPTGDRLVFSQCSSANGQYSTQLYWIHPDAAEVERVASAPLTYCPANPVFHPDGKSLFIERYEPRRVERVWLDERKIVSIEGILPDPSPDGSKLITFVDEAGMRTLSLLDLGTGETYFTVKIDYGQASWSPNSRLIVLTSNAGDPTAGTGQTDLFVIDAQTGSRHRIVESITWEFDPAWSPDGRRIVFRSDGPPRS